jgi:hypothetical protein
MTPDEKFKAIREQIVSDCLKKSEGCLYDQAELHEFICFLEGKRDYFLERRDYYCFELEKAKREIEILKRNQFVALEAIIIARHYLKTLGRSSYTHRRKSLLSQIFLEELTYVQKELEEEACDKSLEKSNFDDIPW